jgi:predicted RNase H-like nuclease (RuvC/YqgF family)
MTKNKAMQTAILLLQDALNQQKLALKEAENFNAQGQAKVAFKVRAIYNLKEVIKELERAISILQSDQSALVEALEELIKWYDKFGFYINTPYKKRERDELLTKIAELRQKIGRAS